VIIHGDPELTAIVARLEVAREYSAQRYPECHVPRLTPDYVGVLSPARSETLIWPGTTWWGPETKTLVRYVRRGTDHADLCANRLTEFSMYLQSLQSTEVA
jgi:hypothetical protein